MDRINNLPKKEIDDYRQMMLEDFCVNLSYEQAKEQISRSMEVFLFAMGK